MWLEYKFQPNTVSKHYQVVHRLSDVFYIGISRVVDVALGMGPVLELREDAQSLHSTHNRPMPSGFGTTSMGAAQALVLSSIIPSANKESICEFLHRILPG